MNCYTSPYYNNGPWEYSTGCNNACDNNPCGNNQCNSITYVFNSIIELQKPHHRLVVGQGVLL